MHIDSFALQSSGSVSMRQGSNTSPLQKQDDVIDGLKTIMTASGWTLLNGIKASGTLYYPLGFPTVSGVQTQFPKRVVGCWNQPFVTLDGYTFTPYDPFNEIPAVGAQCTFFPWGTSIAASLSNLANAVASVPRYTAVVTGVSSGYEITVTARQPGPSFNFPDFHPDGRWGVASEISGGGWELQSLENRDNNNLLRTASYKVKLYSFGSINGQTSHITRPIVCDFSTDFNGYGVALIVLDGQILDARSPFPQGAKGYQLFANPYSFAAVVPDNINATGIVAAAPYIPTEEDFSSAYAVFAVGYPRSGTSWSRMFCTCLDAPMGYYPYSAPGHPRMLALHQPGTNPLMTPSGTPVITNSWVMFAQNSGQPSYVIGKLWDMAIINDYITSPTSIGRRFYPLAQQDGSGYQTRSSLLFGV